jgi:hypothetical protein
MMLNAVRTPGGSEKIFYWKPFPPRHNLAAFVPIFSLFWGIGWEMNFETKRKGPLRGLN